MGFVDRLRAHAFARARALPCEEPFERTQARRVFADHVITPAEVRSFTFRKREGGSAYWFGLTWRAGHLTLVGDLGEMTLTHYSALGDFEGGIAWAASGSYSYLMEKSDKREKELDRDATAAEIVRSANDDAIWATQGVVEERRGYRRDLREACAEWERDLAAWDARRKMAIAELPRRGKARKDAIAALEAERPRLADFLPEHYRVEEARSLRFIRKDRAEWRHRCASYPHTGYDSESTWRIPEGWRSWFRLWQAVRHNLDYDDEDPNIVLTHEGRWRVKEALEQELSDDEVHENDVAELCRQCGFDDYYGSYRYKGHTIWQIEAIQHGCNMILDQIEPKRTWDRVWGDPVV